MNHSDYKTPVSLSLCLDKLDSLMYRMWLIKLPTHIENLSFNKKGIGNFALTENICLPLISRPLAQLQQGNTVYSLICTVFNKQTCLDTQYAQWIEPQIIYMESSEKFT